MIDQNNINEFLSKYSSFVDKIASIYNYENNLKHVLYIMVPSFVIKYGYSAEKMILDVFENTRIIISSKEDDVRQAYFTRNIVRDNGRIVVSKFIVLDKYRTSSLTELLDSLIHEFCHVVNSYNNEVYEDDKYVKLRTGVSFLVYDKSNLNFINKSKEYILEEILNTLNTEEIINIIKSFSKYHIINSELENLIFSLNSETKVSYESNAYNFEKYICGILVKNKTFIPTICNLRFKGFITDIPSLFDGVMGKDGEYDKLNNLLCEIHDLELKYVDAKFFKNRILNKIMNLSKKVIDIINEYDNKCIYR